MRTFLELLAGLTAAAIGPITSVDFSTDVLYSPLSAWHSQPNEVCGSASHYTTIINATAMMEFTGDQIVIAGMRNNASGVIQVKMDDSQPVIVDLWSDIVMCGILFQYKAHNGTHNMTLTLLTPAGDRAHGDNAGVIQNPGVHLTNIAYWTTDPRVEAYYQQKFAKFHEQSEALSLFMHNVSSNGCQ